MVVAVNANWKIPVAYYLISHLSAEEKATILLQVLSQLAKINAKIISVTCDGPATHIKMAQLLGVSTHSESFDSSFIFNDQRIFFILDNCHMIKLMRNVLFSAGVLYDRDGHEINVKFIILLHELQQQQQLHLANKLSSAHIEYKKQIMKVKLASQTLSSSVADAIDFCRDILKLPQFKNSEATTKFIRYCDRLFDLFNSRNPIGRNFKAPMKETNETFWRPFLQDAFSYLKAIKVNTSKLAIHSRKKTPFLGYLTLINSVEGIYDLYVATGKLNYLLTYKLSQDHIELFFSSVRSKGGYNNNPSAKQFSAIFKRLLIHHELTHLHSNCDGQVITPILNVSSKSNYTNTEMVDNSDNFFDTNNINLPDIPFSDYIENVVEYIAGFISKKMINLKCVPCSYAVTDPEKSLRNNLITFINRGGLTFPSKDVIKICQCAERICREILHHIPSTNNLLKYLVVQTLNNLDSNIFDTLKDHIIDELQYDNDHRFWLIQKISELYFKIRLQHMNKLYNLKLKGDNVRKILTKTILFKNQ